MPTVRRTRDPILSGHTWDNNGQLILALARLGILRQNMRILDPTYGEGVFWKYWRPRSLVAHDLYELDGVDVRALPHDEATFDAVTFDPPYVSMGGRGTSGMKDFQRRYGLGQAPKNPVALQKEIIEPGMVECERVAKPGGIILVKCMPYVSSGNTYPGHHLTWHFATSVLGLNYLDEFALIGDVRPQPPRARTIKLSDGRKVTIKSKQHHPRHNPSYLFVFQKPRRRPEPRR